MTTLELIEIDPGTLIVGANIRATAGLDKTFLASIAEHGVKQPIQAYRDDVGALVVVAGQRRTLAAVTAALPLVKVEVIDRPDDTGRIVDQVVENEHRTDMSNADRMRAFEQLSLLGLPAAAIAKKTGHKELVVAAGLVAVADKTAAAAVDEHDLDLVTAAAIAEFADDPKVTKDLVFAAKHGDNMKWLLQRAREDRVLARKRAELIETAVAAGLTILDKRPDTYNGPIALLTDLTAGGKKLTPARHKTCPGHAVFLDQEWKASKSELVMTPVCLDFKKNGHPATESRAARGGRDTSPEAKAERREVIQGNRDWKTATAIRRTWLREFLTGRAAPATAAGFIALCLAADSTVADAQTRSTNAMAQYLLGVADEPTTPTASGYSTRDRFTEYVTKAGEKRALMIALGIVLGAHEAALYGHEWRSTTYSSSKSAARYLRYLQVLGHELTPIELRACGEQATADPESVNA